MTLTMQARAVLRALWEERVSPEPNSGCWLWLGSANLQGYGDMNFRAKRYLATHLSLEFDGRPKPFPGAVARHRCDNPPCVNPDHLLWGTHQENVRDSQERGLLRWSQQRKEHFLARRPSLWCGACGVEFTKPPSHPRRSANHYCSRACANQGLRMRTHCRRGHPFTAENTYINPKDGSRACHECKRAAWVRYGQRRSRAKGGLSRA